MTVALSTWTFGDTDVGWKFVLLQSACQCVSTKSNFSLVFVFLGPFFRPPCTSFSWTYYPLGTEVLLPWWLFRSRSNFNMFESQTVVWITVGVISLGKWAHGPIICKCVVVISFGPDVYHTGEREILQILQSWQEVEDHMWCQSPTGQ